MSNNLSFAFWTLNIVWILFLEMWLAWLRLLPMSLPLTFRFGKCSMLPRVMIVGSSSSSTMMGMGLLLVRRQCTCLVALITLGAVGSFEVGAEIGLGAVIPFTLGGCKASTLGGVVSVMIDCRALTWKAWVILSAAPGGVFCFIICRNCCVYHCLFGDEKDISAVQRPLCH